MRNVLALILSLALAAPSVAFAEDIKTEVKADKASVKDAKKDLKKLSKIVAKWEKAHASGNKEKEAAVDEDLKAWIKEEMAEGRADLKEARAEANDGSGGRKDNVDDANDLEIEVRNFTRTKEVVQQLREIQPRFDNGKAGPKLYKSKSNLLAKLVTLTEADLARMERELEEDKAKK